MELTKSRARGVIALISLLLIFQIVTFVYSKGRSNINNNGLIESIDAEGDTLISNNKNRPLYGYKAPKKVFTCNINIADSSTLVKLSGVGPYFAKKIIQYRTQLGGSFVDIRQLLEIDNFGEERFNRIKNYIYITDLDIKRFSLDSVSVDFLAKHPYIGGYVAREIKLYLMVYKERIANLSTKELIEGLIEENVIDSINGLRLYSYLK